MDSGRLRLFALVLTLVLVQSPARIDIVTDADPYYSVGVGVADLAAVVLIATSLGAMRRAVRAPRRSALVSLAAALGAVLLLAFAVHPSPQGAQTLYRLLVVGAIVAAIHDLRTDREIRFLLFGLAAAALTQTMLSTLQLVNGDLLVIYEHPPVRSYGPFIRTAGTFPDTFVLAGYALVVAAVLDRAVYARRRPLQWAVVAAIAIAPVGFSFSRAAAASVLLLVLVLAVGAMRSHRGRLALAAVLVGVGLPALLTREGWAARDEDSDVTNSANGRIELITQTLPLLASAPLLGIGPSNTMSAVRQLDRERPGSVRLQPPHDVPYLIALEGGIPAGLLGASFLMLAGRRAIQLGTGTTLVYASLVPFLLLDNYPWTAAAGLPLVGLWLGLATRGGGVGDPASAAPCDRASPPPS